MDSDELVRTCNVRYNLCKPGAKSYGACHTQLDGNYQADYNLGQFQRSSSYTTALLAIGLGMNNLEIYDTHYANKLSTCYGIWYE